METFQNKNGLIARKQISLRRSLELALRFALGTKKSQIEALQKFLASLQGGKW